MVFVIYRKKSLLISLGKKKKEKRKKRLFKSFVKTFYLTFLILTFVVKDLIIQWHNFFFFVRRTIVQISQSLFSIVVTIKLLLLFKKKKKESTFITSIYQMIMTFKVVSNFALSRLSNCKYNDIHRYTTRSSYRI